MKRWTNRARVALVTAAAALGAAAIGYGAIPGASGTISGCYERRTGVLRVIDTDAGRACTQWETALAWSQRGPQGPQGEPGPQGPQGQQGPPGPSGIAGWERVTRATAMDATDVKSVVAFCPPGKHVVGGGFGVSAVQQIEIVHSVSHISENGEGWSVFAIDRTASTGNWILNAQAICVS